MAGVGGQGIVLAADVLGRTLMQAGYDVKVSEIHGMAQRGGSVHTFIRFGERVFSPIVERGTADYLLAFEMLEGLRWAPWLGEEGLVIANDAEIKPLPVLMGTAAYPTDIEASLRLLAGQVVLVDGRQIGRDAGNVRAENMALLGCLGKFLEIDVETWHDAIRGRVPAKTVDLNLKAFDLGLKKMSDQAAWMGEVEEGAILS